MKKISILIVMLFAMAGCKKHEPNPIPEIAPIMSKWRPVERIDSKGDTISVASEQTDFLVFRFDGVIVNEAGYKPCCSPNSYILNGQRFEVKPQAPVQEDPSCIYVDCFVCQDTKITQLSENELLIEYCLGNSIKFVREK